MKMSIMTGILKHSIILLFIGTAAKAELVASDQFDYELGTVISGMPGDNALGQRGNGWGTGWYFHNGFSGEVVAGLVFPGVTSSGNALKVSGSSQSGSMLFRGLSKNLEAGTYYMGVIFERTDPNKSTAEHWYWALRHSGTAKNGPASSARFEAGSTSSEKARVRFGEGAAVEGGYVYNLNTPVFMLLRIVIDDTSGANETVSVAMYNSGDVLPSSEDEIVWQATAARDWGGLGRNGWSLILPGGIDANGYIFDEFRLGTQLRDVMSPEPVVGLVSGDEPDTAAPLRPQDPLVLLDRQFADNPQKVSPLAQKHVEVWRSPDPAGICTYDPYIVALPGGRLVGGFQMGGKAADEYCKQNGWLSSGGKPARAVVVTSDDGGANWTVRKRYEMIHQRAFEAGGRLYILGHVGNLCIMRSDDKGETWSDPAELTTGQKWHGSATGYWKSKTHIYIAMEKFSDRGLTAGWKVAQFSPVLMRAPLDADLTQKKSWTFASELVFMDAVNFTEIKDTGIPFFSCDRLASTILATEPRKRVMYPVGWLETNVIRITDPSHGWYDSAGRTLHLLMRANTGGANYAALAKVVENEDGTMTTMLQNDPSGKPLVFLPFPGGHLKFYVLQDEQSGLYWMAGSQSSDSMLDVKKMPYERTGLPNNERHRMALYFSRNAVDWCFAGMVAIGEDMGAGRHYVSMDIDGEDLVIMSRSGNEAAHDAHDGNLVTFHRVKNFRGLIY